MTRPEPLRAGVIGLGAMGTDHARVWSEMPGVSVAVPTRLGLAVGADLRAAAHRELLRG